MPDAELLRLKQVWDNVMDRLIAEADRRQYEEAENSLYILIKIDVAIGQRIQRIENILR